MKPESLQGIAIVLRLRLYVGSQRGAVRERRGGGIPPNAAGGVAAASRRRNVATVALRRAIAGAEQVARDDRGRHPWVPG